MNFLPPENGGLSEIRNFLDANPEESTGAAKSDQKKNWIKKQLTVCQYERLSRSDKGLVRSFILKVSGYSRAQVAREISAYREELGRAMSYELRAERKAENSEVPAVSSRPDDAVSYDPPSSVDADQRRAGLRALSENVETSRRDVSMTHSETPCSGFTHNEAPTASPGVSTAANSQNEFHYETPSQGVSTKAFFRPIFKFVLISSLIVNIALIAMLISMSLYERFEKSAEREQKTIQAIEPNAETPQWGVSTQGVHAAPSSAPQP